MTTLYKPVLIETAEQAEALPEGSIVINDCGDRYNPVRGRRGGWHSSTDDRDLAEDLDSTFMPPTITALVPIEAEEVRVIASGGLERDYHGATVLNHTPDGPRRDYRRTEFHTPWEEA